MFFNNNQQLEEKKARIQVLEDENVRQKQQLEEAHKELDDMVRKSVQMQEQFLIYEKKIAELQTLISKFSGQIETAKNAERTYRDKLELAEEEIREKYNLLESSRERVDQLEKQLNYYRRMNPEEYLKLGTELFTLEELTLILGKAQSDSFASLQRRQVNKIIQRLVVDVQILLCPIRTDIDLLRLLEMVGADSADISEISGYVQRTTIDEITNSSSVDIEKCVLRKQIVGIDARPEDIYIFNIENAERYLKKIAISKLVSVLYKIANWEGY